jgi:hypothetical protein
MKSLNNNLIDIISLSLIGLFVLFFLIPWPFPQIDVKYSQEPFKKQIEFSDKAEKTANRSVTQCAALFGLRIPKSSPQKSTAMSLDKTPQNITWIKYIGLIATPAGEKKYYFKDTRNGRIIRLALGETSDGWTLAKISASNFTLKNEGKVYLVEN